MLFFCTRDIVIPSVFVSVWCELHCIWGISARKNALSAQHTHTLDCPYGGHCYCLLRIILSVHGLCYREWVREKLQSGLSESLNALTSSFGLGKMDRAQNLTLR